MMRRRSNLLGAVRLMAAVIALGLGLCVTAACGRGSTPPEAAKAGKDAHDDHADEKDEGGKAGGEKAGEHAAEGEEHHEEEGGVELSEEAFKRAGIELAEVKAVDASSVLLAPADLQPNADKLARVGPRVSGRIAGIAVSLGATVKAGQALATIRSPEAAEAVAALDTAKAAGTLAEATLARERDLFERKISARREVLEAEAGLATTQAAVRAAEARLAAMGFARGSSGGSNVEPVVTVTSPIAGTVIERAAAADAPVQPDSVLFTIADLRSLWLTVKVPELNAPQVRRGQRVQIEVRALPETPITGAIDSIAPLVDAATRTVDVRLSVPNPQGTLRPGMSATARFEISSTASQDAPSQPGARTSASSARVLVPRAAVQELNQANVVFVTTDEERRFEPKPVTLGASYGPDVEVLSGLTPGDRIVVRGAFTLKAQAVRGAAAHDDH